MDSQISHFFDRTGINYERKPMKIYKEHVVLVVGFVLAIVTGVWFFVSGTFDTSATVDGVVPKNIELIRPIQDILSRDE